MVIGNFITDYLLLFIRIILFLNMLYLFPTELEAKRFSELHPNRRVVISGVGMAATAATLARLNARQPLAGEVVVLAGIAGTYGKECEVGEVVEVVRESVVELPERFREEYSVEPYTSLKPVASNTVSGCGAESCGADIENMEGATLFAMSTAMGFRAVQIRAISNRVGEGFERWHIEQALEALAKSLSEIV